MRRRAARVWAGLLAMLLAAFAMLAVAGAPVAGQSFPPAPTLVPPTLVPVAAAGETDVLPGESGAARIAREGTVRVGILYNEPPFGEFNIRGEVSGFDADLARAIAETWGVSVTFVQATRQTAIDLVATGSIDLLLAAQVHSRDLDSRVEFSLSYYPNTTSLLVREGDGAAVLAHMEGRQVGVVLGTRGESAVRDWAAEAGYAFNIQTFLTLDQAIAALLSSQIDAVADNRYRLTRAVRETGITRFVEEPVQTAPFAIGLRRQDVNLRNLVDRTLQYLFSTGRLNEIHQRYFSGANYPAGALILWANLPGDAPTPGSVPGDVPFPQQYAVPRLMSERVLRVAGLRTLGDDAAESARRLDGAQRALVNALAERWGVTVQIVGEGQDPIELVASGQADLAVGVQPDWNQAGRVDYTGYYMMHGLQLMVENSRDIAGFGDLRGRAIGFFADDAGARELFTQAAADARAIVDDLYTVNREEDAAFSILTDTAINLDGVFGDSMRLLPHIEANPDTLSLLTDADGRVRWFTRTYRALAVPRNDIDYRLLVEYTLQEMALDGTLTQIMAPVMRPQDAPTFEIWPGSSQYLGIELGR
jgi:polar amino acid transport system substrate-binding protein